MSGQRASDPGIAERFRGALPVPVTSIYSRRDGIVAWQCCVNEAGPQAENIEVISSHCGLGHHPAVLYAMADRLAQPEGAVAAFRAAGFLRWMYPTPLATTGCRFERATRARADTARWR